MKAFKDVCAAVGLVVIGVAGAFACLVLKGDAELKVTGKGGKVIYDNSEKFNDKHDEN
jgi:hypothetical protein